METFPDRDLAAIAATDALAGALGRPGRRSLVVTGGSSPAGVYERLSGRDLDWPAVTVTLTDERWVEATSPSSNERLVRERLLTGAAAAAHFLPLKSGGDTPAADAVAVEPALRVLLPWSAVLLGMGEDGHVASLFPGDPDLPGRLDPQGPRLCVPVPAAGLAPFVPRISLTVRALLTSSLVVLLTFGEAKRDLLRRVAADPAFVPPVASIIRQQRTPVRVLWAP